MLYQIEIRTTKSRGNGNRSIDGIPYVEWFCWSGNNRRFEYTVTYLLVVRFEGLFQKQEVGT